MSNFNGYNSNSLPTLEHSLYNNKPVNQSVQEFSIEEPEAPEASQCRQTKAQAFDWDEAIELSYQEDADFDAEMMSWQEDDESEESVYSDARSMNWQDEEDTSQGFELEDDDLPTYDVKTFALDDEESTEKHEDPLSHSNSLFAVEQSVFGSLPVDQPARQFSTVEAFAAIETEESTEEHEDPLSHSNSLFAVEQSVFGPPPVDQPARQFSVELPQTPQVETYAFDWDEAISLEYEAPDQPTAESFDWLSDEEPEQPTAEPFEWLPDEEIEQPTAEPFDWLPTDDSSHSFGLEDEPLTFTVEAFTVEDEEPPTYEAEAFDTDEDLGTAPTEESDRSIAHGFETEEELSDSVAQSSYDNESYGFETEEELSDSVAQSSYDNESYGFETETDAPEVVEKSSDTSQAYDLNYDEDIEILNSQAYSASEAIPVHATVANPPSPPQKSAEPIDFDDLERGMSDTHRASDAEAFAADLAAILRGEKIYEPAAVTPPTPTTPQPQAQPAPQLQAEPVPQPQLPVQPVPQPQPQAQAQPAPQPQPQAQAQSLPPKPSNPHDIFDQMGRSMAHATAFNLGTFSLQQTFDEFDRQLDEEEQAARAYSAEYFSDAEVEDTTHPTETAQSLAFDEAELAADVAALNADEPWQPAVQFQLEETDIAALINNNPPNDNELKSQYLKRLKEKAKQTFRRQYKPKVDDEKIIAAINQLWESASAPKITAKALKERYWSGICLGGTRANPDAMTGYHWAGYEKGKARFRRVGTPIKPEDKFGVYQQKVQHKKTRQQPKVPSTFFPNAWEEKHFNDLFRHFAQRKDFDPDRRGTYTIEAAIDGDERYIGMPILFMPAQNGGGSCIPVWTDSQETESQSEAQELDEPFSISTYEETLFEDEIGEALDFDSANLMDDLDYINEPEIATQMGRIGQILIEAKNKEKLIQTLRKYNKENPTLNNTDQQIIKQIINGVLKQLNQKELKQLNQKELNNQLTCKPHSKHKDVWTIKDSDKNKYYIKITDKQVEIYDEGFDWESLKDDKERELVKVLVGAHPDLNKHIVSELKSNAESLNELASKVIEKLKNWAKEKVSVNFGQVMFAQEAVAQVEKNEVTKVRSEFMEKLYQVYYGLIWTELRIPFKEAIQGKITNLLEKAENISEIDVWFTKRVEQRKRAEISQKIQAFIKDFKNDNLQKLQNKLTNKQQREDLQKNALKAWQTSTKAEATGDEINQTVQSLENEITKLQKDAITTYLSNVSTAAKTAFDLKKLKLVIDEAKYKEAYGGAEVSNDLIPDNIIEKKILLKNDEMIRINISADGMLDIFLTTLAHELAHVIGFNPTGADNKGHFHKIERYKETEKDGLPKLWYDAYFYEVLYE